MFDYFVSLGDACMVAASMAKYGLRSASCVFDWLITLDFSWVLHYMDTDFEDFLLQENLEPYDKHLLRFKEKRSGIIFLHEKKSFQYEYDELRSKYDRRIAQFRKITQNKVCYLRNMRDEEAATYIKNHAEYIRDVIGKHNKESEIVFLCEEELPVPENFPFRYYRMKEKYCGAPRRALRAYFDGAEEFLSFCGQNYSGAELIKNLAFDMKEEQLQADLLQRRYTTLGGIIQHDFEKDVFPDAVVIYGAGVIGIGLYQKIKNYTKVKCFVDEKEAGGELDGIQIISVQNLLYDSEVKIIVSASYDFENIKNQLCNKQYKEEDIISLDDILKLTF